MKILPLIFFFLPLLLGQFLPVLLIAAGVGCLLRRKFGRLKPFFITSAVLMLTLAVNLVHPLIVCPGEFQPYFTHELRDGIREYFTGADDFPVFPLYLEVTDAHDGYLEVKKYWMYGGTTRFAVAIDTDGNVVPDRLG